MSDFICKNCGKSVFDKAEYCLGCGCSVKKIHPGKASSTVSLICGILSCFYTFCFFVQHILLRMSENFNMGDSVQIADFVFYFPFVLIFIASALAVIFGFISHQKGCRLKKRNVGITMGMVSVVVSVLIMVIL